MVTVVHSIFINFFKKIYKLKSIDLNLFIIYFKLIDYFIKIMVYNLAIIIKLIIIIIVMMIIIINNNLFEYCQLEK